MIVPDANLILYAYNTAAPQHEAARAWWEALLSSNETVGLCWQTLTAFLRIGTSVRAFPHPLAHEEAVDIVQTWLGQPMVSLVAPGITHWGILSQLIVDGQITGPLVMDAHLAALAIEYGATLHTHDRDFSRFAGLKLFDPLDA